MFRDKKQREDLRRQLIGEKETMKVKVSNTYCVINKCMYTCACTCI